MKILITGGHLTPALAIIQKLPKNAEVVYVGRKYALEGDSAISLEYQTLTEMGISFVVFHPGRLQRKFTKHTLLSAGRIPKGVWEAIGILRKEKPDVVLSFGGYVAFPFAIAAKIIQIPLITHEQTLEAGATNRLIARLATKICVSWPSSLEFFPPQKTILTGNPLPQSKPTKETQTLLSNIKSKYPLLVITGGSLGSHAINTFIEPILDTLLSRFTILHQTGDAQEFGDYPRLMEMKKHLPVSFQERYILQKFINPADIAAFYQQASLVISRSGINTVEMLLLSNTPALLIPLPHSQRQEQLKNALLLKESGLGEVLLQSELSAETLSESIEMMVKNKTQYINRDLSKMQHLHEHAADTIISIVYDTQTYGVQKKV